MAYNICVTVVRVDFLQVWQFHVEVVCQQGDGGDGDLQFCWSVVVGGLLIGGQIL